MRLLGLVALAGCPNDNRPPCGEVSPLNTLDVDLGGEVPVFSWTPADNDEELVRVTCEPDPEATWMASCSNPDLMGPDPGLGTVCLTSPVTYGNPQRAPFSMDPLELPSGQTCTVVVSQFCEWHGASGDYHLEKRATFVVP